VCCPHLYADGNFKVTHLKAAATATHHGPPVQHRFQDDAKVETFCMDRAVFMAKGSSEIKECNDFAADKPLGRSAAKNDITGWFLQIPPL
jgi:hypothetical protein